jgi:death-on-curing protein
MSDQEARAKNIRTLSVEEVLGIHECLIGDFARSEDPIGPSGVLLRGKVEAAVGRQLAGYHDRLKFDSPVTNAATLGYGLCCGHPFHNGNKRTSLVAMMCHLYRNDWTFEDSISQDALYDFMLNVAKNIYSGKGQGTPDPDVEVEEMSRWIRRRIRRVERGERVITFRELKAILTSYGFVFEEPSGNSVEIVKYETRGGLFGFRKKVLRRRVRRMGNPGDGKTVSVGEIREIRAACALSGDHGVDSHAFYNRVAPVDYFINRYRRTLERLAAV